MEGMGQKHKGLPKKGIKPCLDFRPSLLQQGPATDGEALSLHRKKQEMKTKRKSEVGKLNFA